MNSCYLSRYSDRKMPLIWIYNLCNGTYRKSEQLMKDAEVWADEHLAPLVGPERAKLIFKFTKAAAWAEQNTRDWDGASGGKLTGAAIGYKNDMLWQTAHRDELA